MGRSQLTQKLAQIDTRRERGQQTKEKRDKQNEEEK